MSISTQIERLSKAKQDLKQKINSLGGNLTTQTLDLYADAIMGLSKSGGVYFQTAYISGTGSGVNISINHNLKRAVKVILCFGGEWTAPDGSRIPYYYCGAYDFYNGKSDIVLSRNVQVSFQSSTGTVRASISEMGLAGYPFDEQAYIVIAGDKE